jgi:glycosyltransferase involved in cell wall biosynthesis
MVDNFKLNMNINDDMKIPESALVLSYLPNTGIGTHTKLLFKLGFFNDFILFPNKYFEDKEKLFKEVVNFRYDIIRKISKIFSLYYKNSIWKKILFNYKYIHLADPDFIHLSKFHKNMTATIYDIFPLYQSGYSFFVRQYFRKELNFLNNLKGIVVISNKVNFQLKELYPDANTTVIHLWTDNSFVKRDKIKIRKELGLPFDKIILLNISDDSPRKNIDILPKIMNKLNKNYLLIRIGESKRILNKFKNNNYLVLKNIPDDKFPYYYNAADILIAPSKDEGFGLPIIEAINSNLPIIASNIDVFHEILGDYKYFADLENEEDWIEKIKMVENRIINNEFKENLYAYIGDYYREDRAKKEYIKFFEKIGIFEY